MMISRFTFIWNRPRWRQAHLAVGGINVHDSGRIQRNGLSAKMIRATLSFRKVGIVGCSAGLSRFTGFGPASVQASGLIGKHRFDNFVETFVTVDDRLMIVCSRLQRQGNLA
jgi:hypothetical protein